MPELVETLPDDEVLLEVDTLPEEDVLDLTGVSKEIVTIMQGIAVLSVVIAYELVRRYRITAQQRDVGRQLAAEAQLAEATA